MQEKKLPVLGTIFLAVFFSGCRIETVGNPDKPIKIEAHITVDVRQVKDVAADIEDMVEGKSAPKKKKPESKIDLLNLAYAEETPQLKYRTPEIEAVIASRQARYAEIKSLKAVGAIGENAQGLLSVYSVPPEQEEYVAQIVSAENADREKIYAEIVKQNNLSAGEIAKVKKGFAEEHAGRLQAGEWWQREDGSWQQQ
jgi:uncharacterized protein YdbL (DUF1318 family)